MTLRAPDGQFLFEGAVMDGIPIFNLVRETMPAATITGFRGVVNSTTNYLIDAMERGEPFDAALARMQAAGVAEADPSLDVDGWDAAAKVAALANVWLDARHHAGRCRAARASTSRPASARAPRARRGRRLKLVAQARRSGGAATAARARWRSWRRTIRSPSSTARPTRSRSTRWPLGRIVITQRDGGLEKTAYALLSDLIR